MNIIEFAGLIGVSPTTISHAISGRRYVSEDTRQMIFTKMKELGYVPNVNARRLVSGRTDMVALAFMSADALLDSAAMELAYAIGRPLKSRGYEMVLSVGVDSRLEGKSLISQIRSCAVDGTILVGQSAWIDQIASEKHPCVVIDNSPIMPNAQVGYVQANMKRGVEEVGALLLENGHRTIGFIQSGENDDVYHIFTKYLRERGKDLPDQYVVHSANNMRDGERSMQELMSLPSPPTAVFARTDILAFGAVHGAKMMGLRIPEDVSVIGHDDLPIALISDPPLTTVKLDRAGLGVAAVECICELIGGDYDTVCRRQVDSSIVIRQSVGPRA